MSERGDYLPTLETPRGKEKNENKISPNADFSNQLSMRFGNTSENRNKTEISSSQSLMNRTRSSNLSLIMPNTKSRLLKKLSFIKGMTSQQKPSLLVIWTGTRGFFIVSTTACTALALTTTLSLKPVACTGWKGFYLVFSLIWICNAYFIFEITLLVASNN